MFPENGMLKKFDHYERDGAGFRGPAGACFVTEVMAPGGWKPYEGDGLKPALQGDYLGTFDAHRNPVAPVSQLRCRDKR